MCHLVMAFNVLHLAMPLSVLALLVLPGSAQGPLNATLVSSAKQLAGHSIELPCGQHPHQRCVAGDDAFMNLMLASTPSEESALVNTPLSTVC